MLTLGIDSIEIERFIPWTSFSHKKLLRIFSEEEIAYSFKEPTKTAERLAARFAAKEAFYKAVAQLLPKPASFLTVGKLCSIDQNQRTPQLTIQWTRLDLLQIYRPHVSLTHTTTTATAVVVIVY